VRTVSRNPEFEAPNLTRPGVRFVARKLATDHRTAPAASNLSAEGRKWRHGLHRRPTPRGADGDVGAFTPPDGWVGHNLDNRRACCRTRNGPSTGANPRNPPNLRRARSSTTHAAAFTEPNQIHLTGAFGLSSGADKHANSMTNSNLTYSGVPLVSRETDVEALNLTHSGVRTVSRDSPHAPPDGPRAVRPVSRKTANAQAHA
jgi:hypothetical protein